MLNALHKGLILACVTLLAVVVGTGAALLAKSDGATGPASVRAGCIGFGTSLTLLLLAITTYTLL
jgi:hypothetical protein